MLDLIQTAAPEGTLIGLDEAKLHLGVDADDQDALITALIASATSRLDGPDGVLGRCLLTQSWRLHLRRFPCERIIRLPLVPLQSVESVAYLDTAGATQTLPTSTYWTRGERIGEIELAEGCNWPDTAVHGRAVTIEFTAGYGDAAAVPALLKSAMLLLIGHLFANREAVSAGPAAPLPLGFEALIDPFRTWRM